VSGFEVRERSRNFSMECIRPRHTAYKFAIRHAITHLHVVFGSQEKGESQGPDLNRRWAALQADCAGLDSEGLCPLFLRSATGARAGLQRSRRFVAGSNPALGFSHRLLPVSGAPPHWGCRRMPATHGVAASRLGLGSRSGQSSLAAGVRPVQRTLV